MSVLYTVHSLSVHPCCFGECILRDAHLNAQRLHAMTNLVLLNVCCFHFYFSFMLIVLVECTELLRQVGGISTFTYSTTLLLHSGHCHVLPLRRWRCSEFLLIKSSFHHAVAWMITHDPTHRPVTARPICCILNYF